MASASRWLFDSIQAKVGNPQRKLLLIILADMADKKGECWPSHSYLAERAECSRRSVITHLMALESDGFISVERRSKNGIKTSSMYRILHVQDLHNDVQDLHHRCEPFAQGGSEPFAHKTPTLIKLPIKHPIAFDDFWAVYPRKAGKTAALKAWTKLDPPQSLVDRIINDCQERLRQGEWQETRKQFIPHPATYLNGQRWEDEITPSDTGDSHAAGQSNNSKQSRSDRIRAATFSTDF